MRTAKEHIVKPRRGVPKRHATAADHRGRLVRRGRRECHAVRHRARRRANLKGVSGDQPAGVQCDAVVDAHCARGDRAPLHGPPRRGRIRPNNAIHRPSVVAEPEHHDRRVTDRPRRRLSSTAPEHRLLKRSATAECYCGHRERGRQGTIVHERSPDRGEPRQQGPTIQVFPGRGCWYNVQVLL